MAVGDNIEVAQEFVGEVQGQLGNVEDFLDQAEQVTVEGKRIGRCFRRLFRLLLLVALVAAVIVAIKKILGARSSADEVVIEETIIDEVVVDEDGNVLEETIVDDVVVAADGEVAEATAVIEADADEEDAT
mgnify:FL=1